MTRLVKSLEAFEWVTGFDEPHYRLVVLFALLASRTAPLSNTELKNMTGWSLPRIQAFLQQLSDSGLITQSIAGRSSMNIMTTDGVKKAQAITRLLKEA